jgi:hypothetical protein
MREDHVFVGVPYAPFKSIPAGAIMTRTMYDALETSGIPAGAQIAAWYPYDTRNTSGPPRNAHQVLTIDNTGQHPNCDILDVEPGAATVAGTPGWVRACTAPFPTIYSDLANAPTVVSALRSVGRRWYLWVADWQNGTRNVPGVAGATVIGCQYAGNVDNAYDLSIITDDSWYPVPLPAYPAPAGLSATCNSEGLDISWTSADDEASWHAQVVTAADESIYDGVVTVPYVCGLDVPAGTTQVKWRVAADASATHQASPWTELQPFTIPQQPSPGESQA